MRTALVLLAVAACSKHTDAPSAAAALDTTGWSVVPREQAEVMVEICFSLQAAK